MTNETVTVRTVTHSLAVASVNGTTFINGVEHNLYNLNRTSTDGAFVNDNSSYDSEGVIYLFDAPANSTAVQLFLCRLDGEDDRWKIRSLGAQRLLNTLQVSGQKLREGNSIKTWSKKDRLEFGTNKSASYPF